MDRLAMRWCWRRVPLYFLLVVLALAAGCSDDAPPGDGDSLKGKTPVVRPEDMHARGGGSVALAPDYRQGMTARLDPALEAKARNAGKKDKAPGQETAKATPAGRFCPPGRPEQVVLGPETPATASPEATPPTPAVAAQTAGASQAPDRSVPPATPSAPLAIPQPGAVAARSRQLVLVTAPDWNASHGTLRLFERQDTKAPWRESGAAAECALGRHGLGFGRGLTAPLPGVPVKRQGDGRSPAGVFTLPAAFGYAGPEAAKAAGVRLPYAYVTDRSACVTDPASRLFGQIAGPEERQAAGGARQDRMLRPDGANLWGVLIGHNRDNPESGAGSCVFVNVRPAGASSTGGSIGCPEAVAAKLASWLDPAAEPLLVVLPAGEYRQVKEAWGLP